MLTLWLLAACTHEVQLPDTDAPLVEILRPGAGETVIGEFSFCARVSDGDPLDRLERSLAVDDVVVAEEDVFGLCEGGNSGVEIEIADEGTHTLRLEVTDRDGGVGADEVDIEVEAVDVDISDSDE